MHVAPRWARRSLALLVLLGAVHAALLGGAVPASAHAALRETDPMEGTVLSSAPKQVTLIFRDGVSLSDDSVRVLDPDNQRVNPGQAEHVAGKRDTVRVKLRGNLPTGTFTVAWHVVSADSHPISGAFTFSVGKQSATAAAVPSVSPQDTAAGTLYDIGRYVAYGGLALLLGVTTFVLGCWPSGASLPALRKLLLAGWSALVLSTVALLMLRGPYETGGSPAAAFDLSVLRGTLGTKPGIALVARLLLLGLAGVMMAVVARRFGRRAVGTAGPDSEAEDGGQRRNHRWVGLLAGGVLAVGLAGTWVAAEHASVGIQVPMAMVSTAMHLLAMAVWLGGLAALLTALYRAAPGERIPAEAVTRFSRIAFSAIVVLVATGIYQSWRQVGSWDTLLTTSYGKLLIVKFGVVLLVLIAAAYSRRWTARWGRIARAGAAERPEPARGRIPEPVGAAHSPETASASATGVQTARPAEPASAQSAADALTDTGAEPHRRGLRRWVLAEVAAGAAVLAVTTMLTGTQPGRAEAASSAAAAAQQPAVMPTIVPFDVGTPNGKGKVQVVLEPARVGENTVQAVVLTPDEGIMAVPELRITFTLRDRNIGPIDAKLIDRKRYWEGENLRLPLPGTWTMRVTVRVSDFDQVTASKAVEIGEDARSS